MMPSDTSATPFNLAEFPPRWARFCLSVESFISKELHVNIYGKTLLLPVSAGVDSTVLAHVFFALKERLQCTLHGVHIDHAIRPESHQDAEFASDLCAQLHMPFYMKRVQIERIAQRKGLGLEEAGRHVRYAYFKSVAKKIHADWIVLAHHANDLSEDILMRLIRGTSWPSLGGMSGCDPKRRILRPFLVTPKETLRNFAQELAIPWREDRSNTDLAYLRNRVRHTLLPLFLKENPLFLQQTTDLWKMARYDEGWFEDHALPIYEEESTCGLSRLIPDKALQQSVKAARLRAYKAALDAFPKSRSRSDLLFNLDDAVMAKRRGKIIQFPGPVQARVTKHGVYFEIKPKRLNTRTEIDTTDDQG